MGCICSYGPNKQAGKEPDDGDKTAKIKPLPDPSEGKMVVPSYPKKEVVAFTAKLNIAHSTPYHRGVLKLVDVVTNEGNGYSPETGLFVCPLKGMYFFTVHMSVAGRAHCEIYKNGEIVTTLYDTSHPHDCTQVATISTIVELKEEDKVWVNLWGHGRHEIIATEEKKRLVPVSASVSHLFSILLLPVHRCNRPDPKPWIAVTTLQVELPSQPNSALITAVPKTQGQ
ncbi:hypothetical protein WMY93_028162 [Mugilogobius chulae]|uniref:C1q domain-containing protein n=1 Tax=Mugilogobius chulae TaxID=88201 RepID=A0AAW0MZN9_9GOBI